ncbi:carbonate dehydratase [Frateuria sp. Soil773]|uniref:LysR family transcriptional regulator n=1 Tax=Frateuria sp. Soil773 TaxID=1736407 RepID=UPI000701825E|nr:LysR family transcriptional regulator [Frateuria sp. Soil773]KRE89160.1 carbonate dehydratase [Frateuria sp. Soil773]
MRLPLVMLEVFDAIVRAGSLRAAADSLQLKPSTVSHQLKALEQRIGAPLFIRTTRSLTLTDAGHALSQGCRPAFEQLAQSVRHARDAGGSTRGQLRITMPEFAYHTVLAPFVGSFRAAWPDIGLEIVMSDAFVDLAAAGIHAGIRSGDLVEQNMIAVRISKPLPLAVYASAGYLARRGSPRHPRDLLDHDCIRYRFHSSGRTAPWVFQGTDGAYAVDVGGGLIVNDLPTLYAMIDDGLGLGYVLRDAYGRGPRNRKRVALFEREIPPAPALSLYFPSEYRAMVPLRLFIEHLRAGIGSV